MLFLFNFHLGLGFIHKKHNFGECDTNIRLLLRGLFYNLSRLLFGYGFPYGYEFPYTRYSFSVCSDIYIYPNLPNKSRATYTSMVIFWGVRGSYSRRATYRKIHSRTFLPATAYGTPYGSLQCGC